MHIYIGDRYAYIGGKRHRVDWPEVSCLGAPFPRILSTYFTPFRQTKAPFYAYSATLLLQSRVCAIGILLYIYLQTHYDVYIYSFIATARWEARVKTKPTRSLAFYCINRSYIICILVCVEWKNRLAKTNNICYIPIFNFSRVYNRCMLYTHVRARSR